MDTVTPGEVGSSIKTPSQLWRRAKRTPAQLKHAAIFGSFFISLSGINTSGVDVGKSFISCPTLLKSHTRH